MKRFLKFQATFGWAEVIALIALIFAVMAFLEGKRASHPTMSVEYFPIGVGAVHDQKSSRRMFGAIIPLVFTNSGGSATSLLTFRPSQHVAPVLLVANGRASSEGAPSEFLLLSRMIETIQEWEAFSPLLKRFDPAKDPPLLNMIIPAGESRVIYLGLVVDAYGRGVTSVLVALEAEFSNGTSQPIRAGIEVTPAKDVR